MEDRSQFLGCKRNIATVETEPLGKTEHGNSPAMLLEHKNLVEISSFFRIESSWILFFGQDCFVNRELGGGFKYVLFSPLPGEMIQFD